jgi:hypothetical protein
MAGALTMLVVNGVHAQSLKKAEIIGKEYVQTNQKNKSDVFGLEHEQSGTAESVGCGGRKRRKIVTADFPTP